MPVSPEKQSWQGGGPGPESYQGQALGPAERNQLVRRVYIALVGPEARKFKFTRRRGYRLIGGQRPSAP